MILLQPVYYEDNLSSKGQYCKAGEQCGNVTGVWHLTNTN